MPLAPDDRLIGRGEEELIPAFFMALELQIAVGLLLAAGLYYAFFRRKR